MPKEATTYDPYMDVEFEDIYVDNKEYPERKAVCLSLPGSDKIPVGFVSPNYQIIENAKADQIAKGILESANLEYATETFGFNGKHFRKNYRVINNSIEPFNGDEIALVLTALNSYDGSSQFKIALNAKRLICSNGMVVSAVLGGISFSHYSGEGLNCEIEDAAYSLRGNLGNLATLIEPIQNMARRVITIDDLKSGLKKLSLPNRIVADTLLNLEHAKYYDSTHSLTHNDNYTIWDFYNALTASIDLKSRTGYSQNAAVSRDFFAWAA